MWIWKTSPISGERNSLWIPVTDEQINDWQAGALIQDVMPELNDEQREFLMTGITPREWQEQFGG